MLLPNSWTLEEKQVFHTCISMEFMECPNKGRTDAEVLPYDNLTEIAT